ncbi:MAG: hypothetical protein OEO20_10515 [Gemmatimonadota bacterium]|nr:hypothetical protein [Gemmatimonadota bacterium]MDH3368389.1 hypothetical protein [Gemmatimonadota bacterium]MDH3478726.1 hypothetical protein [Gemmatimonadota bacterium]MDH3570302.1 hypothetical protein [Gemmatimonadota bacterium]MDH5549588.1 hypothetical protein [Gemmatimonadota bacterium]
MDYQEPHAQHPGDPTPSRRPWATPQLTELPRLTDLTLQTGSPIGGGGAGGSTVF